MLREVEFKDNRTQISAPILNYIDGTLTITGMVAGDVHLLIALNDTNGAMNFMYTFDEENKIADITWLFELSEGDVVYAKYIVGGVYDNTQYIESEWSFVTIS